MFTNLNGSKVPRDARTILWIVPANFTAMCASDLVAGVAAVLGRIVRFRTHSTSEPSCRRLRDSY